MRWVARAVAWLIAQYMQDYRENMSRTYELTIKNNTHLNTIILTVSVASLTAVAALNKRAFEYYPVPSFIVILLFISVILLSTVNFFLSGIVTRDIQQNLSKDILFPVKVSRRGYVPRFRKSQKVFNVLVLCGFCLGLIALLGLLGLYIMGAK